MSLHIAEDQSVTLSHARQMACLEAVWELDALARVLPDLVPRDGDGVYLSVRGIAGRLTVLANALMAGLDDGVVSDADLERRILLAVEGG